MKIYILTHALHTNYGGLLQAYALQKILKEKGHIVATDKYGPSKKNRLLISPFILLSRFCLLHINKSGIIEQFSRILPFKRYFKFIQRKHTEQFVEKHINTIDLFRGNKYPNKTQLLNFNVIIVGSDQVWRAKYKTPTSYFLDFCSNLSIKRISYAASFGVDHWDEYTDSMTDKCSFLAKKFKAISVREDSGVTLCKDHLDIDATHVLDPTLLLEKEDYIELVEQEDQTKLSDILMGYVLDETEEKYRIISEIAKKLSLHPHYVKPEAKFSSAPIDISKCIYPSVSKWIRGFRDAKFVVTDSFHGTVFAIIFNIPFVSIANASRGSARFSSLLKLFNLEHRIISSTNDLTPDLLEPIDFSHVNDIKQQLQAKSINFLKHALKE